MAGKKKTGTGGAAPAAKAAAAPAKPAGKQPPPAPKIVSVASLEKELVELRAQLVEKDERIAELEKELKGKKGGGPAPKGSPVKTNPMDAVAKSIAVQEAKDAKRLEAAEAKKKEAADAKKKEAAEAKKKAKAEEAAAAEAEAAEAAKEAEAAEKKANTPAPVVKKETPKPKNKTPVVKGAEPADDFGFSTVSRKKEKKQKPKSTGYPSEVADTGDEPIRVADCRASADREKAEREKAAEKFKNTPTLAPREVVDIPVGIAQDREFDVLRKIIGLKGANIQRVQKKFKGSFATIKGAGTKEGDDTKPLYIELTSPPKDVELATAFVNSMLKEIRDQYKLENQSSSSNANSLAAYFK